jgi:hypothetical protein
LPVGSTALRQKGLITSSGSCPVLNCTANQALLIFEGRQCPMTPAVDYGGSVTAVATRRVRVPVIRSPPGSQLERNRAFWRMISASFMQDSDANHHRRNGRRSASVTRSPATSSGVDEPSVTRFAPSHGRLLLGVLKTEHHATHFRRARAKLQKAGRLEAEDW